MNLSGSSGTILFEPVKNFAASARKYGPTPRISIRKTLFPVEGTDAVRAAVTSQSYQSLPGTAPRTAGAGGTSPASKVGLVDVLLTLPSLSSWTSRKDPLRLSVLRALRSGTWTGVRGGYGTVGSAPCMQRWIERAYWHTALSGQ